LLDRADSGVEWPKVADATPFPAYSLHHAVYGTIYLWHGDGALEHEVVARSISDPLAKRVVDVLNRAKVRPRRRWRGPFKSYF
jgi:hypothetical protein